MGEVRRFHTVLHLDDTFTDVAESAARRYGVPVRLLVEALLLGCLDTAEEERVRPEIEATSIRKESRRPKRRRAGSATGPAKVLSLDVERARRSGHVVSDPGHLRAYAKSVLAAAHAARERARSICEKARAARARASVLLETSPASARHASL